MFVSFDKEVFSLRPKLFIQYFYIHNEHCPMHSMLQQQ